MNCAWQPSGSNIFERVFELGRRPRGLIATHPEADDVRMGVGNDLARNLHGSIDAEVPHTGHDQAALDIVIASRIIDSSNDTVDVILIAHAGVRRVIGR